MLAVLRQVYPEDDPVSLHTSCMAKALVTLATMLAPIVMVLLRALYEVVSRFLTNVTFLVSSHTLAVCPREGQPVVTSNFCTRLGEVLDPATLDAGFYLSTLSDHQKGLKGCWILLSS